MYTLTALTIYFSLLIACIIAVFYFFSLSAGMKRIFMMLVVVETVIWLTHWPLGLKILFSFFGVAVFVLMLIIEKPTKDIIEKPFFHNEGIWSDITNYKN